MSISSVLNPIINIGVYVLIAYVMWRVGRIIYSRIKEVTKTKADRDLSSNKNNQSSQQQPRDYGGTESPLPVRSMPRKPDSGQQSLRALMSEETAYL